VVTARGLESASRAANAGKTRSREVTNRTLCGLALSVAALLGCSGSGGGGQPSQALLRLSVEGSAPSLSIKGVQMTLELPAGVTIAASEAGKIDGAALSASGAAAGGSALLAGHFTPATSSAQSAAKVMLARPTGFDAGEFATVTCAIAKGASPRWSELRISGFKAVDEDGVEIKTVNGTFTVETK
jgi:hypothetical protein